MVVIQSILAIIMKNTVRKHWTSATAGAGVYDWGDDVIIYFIQYVK